MRVLKGPASHPRIVRNAALVVSPIAVVMSAVVDNGIVTFNLTENGTENGKAIFKNIYPESATFWVDDAGAQYQFSGWDLHPNRKTLKMTVNRLGTVLLGIIQFTAAANGKTVNLMVWGDAK